MSNFNIKRAVENITGRTNTYTPLIEIIVNAIQAIEKKKEANGVVEIVVLRNKQQEMGIDDRKNAVLGFRVTDNGIGFNDENRNSFDELFSAYKVNEGGKGFGRLTALKYYEDVSIDSVFYDGSEFKQRSFFMGKGNDLIEKEHCGGAIEQTTGSSVSLLSTKKPKFSDNKLGVIASAIVEKLLLYFVSDKRKCPQIILKEEDGTDSIILNGYLEGEENSKVFDIPIPQKNFSLEGLGGQQEDFTVRLFKFYSPKATKSRISLVAHRREVTSTAVHTYIPEFTDDFFDSSTDEGADQGRNYIIKAYVFGDYLDKHVSIERGDFDFDKDSDGLYGLSQKDIEYKVAELLQDAVPEIDNRIEKKRRQVQRYVDTTAPWHKSLLNSADLSQLPYNPADDEIEEHLQREKYTQEVSIRLDVKALLDDEAGDDAHALAADIVKRISSSSKNDLVHYIAQRHCVLDIFNKSLSWNEDKKYDSEGEVHDIIFPRRKDTDTIDFEDHNLWILDERLNFTNFVSSDQPLDGAKGGRPDILTYDNPVAFRGENDPSNPITIFEFKRPGRDDFANASSNEDPIQQIIRYAKRLKQGKFKTPEGRQIKLAETTPFYGYVVCSLDSEKVREWLAIDKDFQVMPDNEGYFKWLGNLSLYIEVLSWDKVLGDAKMRNAIFFKKLGL